MQAEKGRWRAEAVARGVAGLCAAVASLAGCAEEPDVAHLSAPVAAYCNVSVDGVGTIPVETDYLPHVVACENGAADFEALKAQAVAARSFVYYKIELYGHVGDGTGDQVYSCANPPGPQHYDAVEATSGQILTYNDVIVCAFYVAGALQSPPSCMGGTNDPTGTEWYVTYNEGLTGDDIEQTPLGWVDPANDRNRGCMSQNGSDCLSEDGHGYEYILRFYYGADINIETAVGSCVTPPSDSGVTPPPSDSGVTPPPSDSGVTPPPSDGGGPWPDGGGPPPGDGGWPPQDGGGPQAGMPTVFIGGCAIGRRGDPAGAAPPALAALLLGLGVAAWRRGRRPFRGRPGGPRG